MPATSTLEGAPLADYFWIAGLDGSEVFDTYRRLGDEYRINRAASPGPALTDAIQEDADAEEEDLIDGASRPNSTLFTGSRRASQQRLSTLSRDSGQTNGASSNRSSVTVKGASSPIRGSALFSDDFDFDQALVKFASERDTFLTDLNVSAGAITQNTRPRSRVRTQKIVADDGSSQAGSPGLLRSGIGSVRRHMAFRDMNSMKRQPSIARHGESMQSREKASYPLNSLHLMGSVNSIAMLIVNFPNSFCTNLTTTQQLQLGDPCTSTTRVFACHASVETPIRARLAGPIPHPWHGR